MTDNPETPSEVSPRDASFWLCEIEAAKDRMSGWYRKAEQAEDRYRGGEDEDDAQEFGGLNIFWSNVETQKAAIGEDFGKPQVTRVNMPEDDGGLSRHVSLIWERALVASVRDSNDNHDIALAVGDIFIPGKGQVWVEVEADDTPSKWIKAPIVRVPYKDYLEGPASRWGSVPWVARRHFFTRDELETECRLSPEEAALVPLNIKLPYEDRREDPRDTKGEEQFKRAEVWEIWAKFPEKSRIFVACGYKDKVLRYDRDPLRLKSFFPCPRPVLANGDESKPPLTDFSRYQDQAEELDRICQRIFVLTESMRRVGVHDKQYEELGDLAEAEENTSIAIENWAGLQQSGGLNKVQEWLDLVPTSNVLATLHTQRDTLIRLIYELSGISDLARGHTDPDETLGAQKLKQSFGSSRFKRREKESRRFASEAYQIKGEIVAELFSREQLQEMSGVKLPLRKEIDDARASLMKIQQAAQLAQQQGMPFTPNQQQIEYLTKLAGTKFAWEDVKSVLQSDYRRCYSVEVETDQSQFVDEEADKAARSEFFQAVMQAIQQIAPMIQGNPKTGEIFKQMVMFVIGSFKSGRAMEEGIERVIDEAIQQAMQQKNQPPQMDPTAQAQVQIAQAGVQKAQVSLQTAQVNLQRAQIEAQNKGADVQAEAQKAQLKQVEAAQKVQAQNDANQAKRVGHEIDLQNKAEKAAFESATRATAQEALTHGPTRAPQNGASA